MFRSGRDRVKRNYGDFLKTSVSPLSFRMLLIISLETQFYQFYFFHLHLSTEKGLCIVFKRSYNLCRNEKKTQKYEVNKN
eukprot:snap_masked-scaffold_11-processed-gene-2.11-mRNA-1 protein AED:1.00 eAED:1.00 QI:0/0/0/0/1/1/2/0/79